jgi:hypothetical protein
MAEIFTAPPKMEDNKTQDLDEPVWTYRGTIAANYSL